MMKTSIDIILNNISDNKQKTLIRGFFVKDVQNYKQELIYLYKLANRVNKYDEGIKKKIYLATHLFLTRALLINRKITNRFLIKSIKQLFRTQVGPLIYKSRFLQHGYIKPAGYPGDHFAIENIYANKPISKGFGCYFDLLALNDGYAKAIRDRKNEMKKRLLDFININKHKSLDILNLGAGSCKEIREFLDIPVPYENLHITLIDQDKNALSYSRAQLKKYANTKLKFEYIAGNIISISRNSDKFKNRYGTYDMVYSIGLADYIPEYYLKKVIKFAFDILKQQGKLIVAHKNIVTHNSLLSDWFCDWNFIPRDKNILLDIFKNTLKGRRYKLVYEKIKEGRIVFISVIKK